MNRRSKSPKKSPKSSSLHIRLPDTLKVSVSEKAAENKWTPSELVRRAIEYWLENSED